MEFKHRDQFGVVLNELGLRGVGVEVGTQYGNYAAKILSTWEGKKLVCVDPWVEQDCYKENWTKGADFEDVFHKCCELAKQHPRMVLLRAFSHEAAKLIEDNSLDFVYIDGNHSYDWALQDLRLWWPKVKKGGVFSGHDYYNCTDPGALCEVRTAVDVFFNEIEPVLQIHLQVTSCTSWWNIK